jgi:hypothetical protein
MRRQISLSVVTRVVFCHSFTLIMVWCVCFYLSPSGQRFGDVAAVLVLETCCSVPWWALSAVNIYSRNPSKSTGESRGCNRKKMIQIIITFKMDRKDKTATDMRRWTDIPEQ